MAVASGRRFAWDDLAHAHGGTSRSMGVATRSRPQSDVELDQRELTEVPMPQHSVRVPKVGRLSAGERQEVRIGRHLPRD